MTFQILRGDCLSRMREFPDSYFDSIVTDPPYELGFMGKSWDASGIAYSVDMWREALRVLKPGGHLLAFSGSRTYHRMTCAIEDAGFEVRDQIFWCYGSGFPKSLDVSKAIDKAAGAVREQGAPNPAFRSRQLEHNAQWETAMRPEFKTLPATDAARQWEGWGTALKPAHEPICVARKPLAKGLTVAANVLQFGTGALNIDGCRVEGPGGVKWETPRGGIWTTDSEASAKLTQNEQGRWPANLIHDGSDEVVALFPANTGQSGPLKTRNSDKTCDTFGEFAGNPDASFAPHDERGSAARFFYCAKASRAERNKGLLDPGPQFKHGATLRQVQNTATWGNTHPTVKPLALMQYLCRLVTPPGGHVLEPFAGSGSTIVAGLREGFRVTGIELADEYADIAERRAEDELYGDLI